MHKDMRHLYDQVVFEPTKTNKMTTLEQKRTMESPIFLNEKRDKTIKDKMCANGST